MTYLVVVDLRRRRLLLGRFRLDPIREGVQPARPGLLRRPHASLRKGREGRALVTVPTMSELIL